MLRWNGEDIRGYRYNLVMCCLDFKNKLSMCVKCVLCMHAIGASIHVCLYYLRYQIVPIHPFQSRHSQNNGCIITVVF